jgi:hypothetical protein
MGYGGNVVARNVTCDNGHGIAIGSVSHGTVANVTVEDIRFFDSRNGVRIKAYPNHTGLVSGITFRNIQLTRVKTPIAIDGHYCPHPPCPPGSVAVLIRDITFEDIALYPRHGGEWEWGCRQQQWRRRKVRLHGNHPAPGAAAACGRRRGELPPLRARLRLRARSAQRGDTGEPLAALWTPGS